MTQPVLSTIDIEEFYYVDTLVHSDLRHEYVDGVMLAMTGGSPLHSQLAGEIIVQLGVQLRDRPCKVHSADLRVRAKAFHRVFYPDVVIECGTPNFDRDDRHGQSLTNPLVIVEVLSPSTSRYDFETKLPAYKSIDSLRSIFYVHQSRRLVECWVSLPSRSWEWVSHSSGSFEVIGLSNVVFDVDGLYSKTDLTR